MLKAGGAPPSAAERLVEPVIAPAYLWAGLGRTLEPERDGERLVRGVLAVLRDDAERAPPG